MVSGNNKTFSVFVINRFVHVKTWRSYLDHPLGFLLLLLVPVGVDDVCLALVSKPLRTARERSRVSNARQNSWSAVRRLLLVVARTAVVGAGGSGLAGLRSPRANVSNFCIR